MGWYDIEKQTLSNCPYCIDKNTLDDNDLYGLTFTLNLNQMIILGVELSSLSSDDDEMNVVTFRYIAASIVFQ